LTERLTIDEARKRGYLESGELRTTTERTSPELRQAKEEGRRKEAFMGLVRQLLEEGWEVRLEHPFHPTRRWRFDLALLGPKVAVEIDGGGWVGGRHHREQGRRNDNQKATEAQRLGWLLVRVSWEHILDGQALELIREVAKERGR
jgi:very-short-patch-repair endonuclease